MSYDLPSYHWHTGIGGPNQNAHQTSIRSLPKDVSRTLVWEESIQNLNADEITYLISPEHHVSNTCYDDDVTF